MSIPIHLKHHPIIFSNNYQNNDGHFSNQTDARYLSIGFAQFDPDSPLEEREIGCKVWRFDDANNKWSRQSEELPIHRVLDLTILLLSTIGRQNNVNLQSYLNAEIVPNQEIHIDRLNQFLNENQDVLNTRIEEIRRLINQLNIET